VGGGERHLLGAEPGASVLVVFQGQPSADAPAISLSGNRPGSHTVVLSSGSRPGMLTFYDPDVHGSPRRDLPEQLPQEIRLPEGVYAVAVAYDPTGRVVGDRGELPGFLGDPALPLYPIAGRDPGDPEGGPPQGANWDPRATVLDQIRNLPENPGMWIRT